MNTLSNYGNVRKIPNFEGYFATDCGKILSRLGKDFTELKPNLGSGGNPKLTLRKDGKSVTKYVKNLVAEAFLVKPKGLKNLVIWHIDENRLNNAVSNLEYMEFRKLAMLTNNHDYRNSIKNEKKQN